MCTSVVLSYINLSSEQSSLLELCNAPCVTEAKRQARRALRDEMGYVNDEAEGKGRLVDDDR